MPVSIAYTMHDADGGHVRGRECGMSVDNAGVECEVVVMLCEYRLSK